MGTASTPTGVEVCDAIAGEPDSTKTEACLSAGSGALSLRPQQHLEAMLRPGEPAFAQCDSVCDADVAISQWEADTKDVPPHMHSIRACIVTAATVTPTSVRVQTRRMSAFITTRPGVLVKHTERAPRRPP
jgi:hypothetical protein